MPPKPRAFVVTLVFGDHADVISTGFWIANEPPGAAALAVHAAVKGNPDIPPLAGCTVTEITEDNLAYLLDLMRSANGQPQQLQFVKPEGSA